MVMIKLSSCRGPLRSGRSELGQDRNVAALRVWPDAKSVLRPFLPKVAAVVVYSLALV